LALSNNVPGPERNAISDPTIFSTPKTLCPEYIRFISPRTSRARHKCQQEDTAVEVCANIVGIQ